jgi:hypothetical protein
MTSKIASFVGGLDDNPDGIATGHNGLVHAGIY